MGDADHLLLIASIALSGPGKLVFDEEVTMDDIDTIVHAVRFHRMPNAFKLRALVEEWSRTKIVREMY